MAAASLFAQRIVAPHTAQADSRDDHDVTC